MGSSDVLKVLKIARAVGKCNLRNARAGSYDFLFIIFSTKLLKRATFYALRATLNTSMVSNAFT